MNVCRICDKSVDVESFSDWVCPNCNQEYAFDEGVMIQLTSHQLHTLRADFKIRESHLTETTDEN